MGAVHFSYLKKSTNCFTSAVITFEYLSAEKHINLEPDKAILLYARSQIT